MKKRKFNALDLAILLVIVAVLALGGWKLLGKGQQQSTETAEVEIVYTASVHEVRDVTARQFHVGDGIYDITTDAFMGTITDVEVVPYMVPESDSQGNPIMVPMTGYYTVNMVVAAPCIERENGYFLSDLVELKVGSSQQIYSKYVHPECEISGILSVGGEALK